VKAKKLNVNGLVQLLSPKDLENVQENHTEEMEQEDIVAHIEMFAKIMFAIIKIFVVNGLDVQNLLKIIMHAILNTLQKIQFKMNVVIGTKFANVKIAKFQKNHAN